MKCVLKCAPVLLILLCTLISVILHADDNDIVIDYIFARTILLEQDEVYNKEPDCGIIYCNFSTVDSSYTITDTLRGICQYLLYFDTTKLDSGIELHRTQDSLFLMFRLNRTIRAYNSAEFANAPREIIVADSLMRKFLSSKRVWMDLYTPMYIPYHPVSVVFSIAPFKKEDDVKAVEKKKR